MMLIDTRMRRSSRFLQGAGTDPAEIANIREALAAGTYYYGRVLNYKKDGTPFWNLLTIAPIKDEIGYVLKLIGMQVEGTQIQATMFNEAANKFYPRFELGKVYYISKGSLRVANRQFQTVQNDYEMTLNENAVVEEAYGETFIPETKHNFVKIDQLGSYVNGRELVDVVGIVQNVSSSLSVRRKIDNETIPKREITIADDSNKIVIVSLWNDLATSVGQELLDAVDIAPVVAIKGLKVGDFQGVSLSTISRSTVMINPNLQEVTKLRSWIYIQDRSCCNGVLWQNH